MTKFKYLFLLFTIFTFRNMALAQQVDGCLVSGTLYPVNSSGSFGASYAACTIGAGWVYTSSSGNFTQNLACFFSGGSYGTYDCPIDDSILFLLLCSAVAGFYLVKRTSLCGNLFLVDIGAI